jgi:hypothetical protein
MVTASFLTEPTMPTSSVPNLDAAVSLLAMLAHPSTRSETDSTFEVGENNLIKLRWQRAGSALLKPDAFSYVRGSSLKMDERQ